MNLPNGPIQSIVKGKHSYGRRSPAYASHKGANGSPTSGKPKITTHYASAVKDEFLQLYES